MSEGFRGAADPLLAFPRDRKGRVVSMRVWAFGCATMLLACLAWGVQGAVLPSGDRAGPQPVRGATYLGGAGYDRAQGCAVDSAGYIYVHGNTHSDDLPATSGVLQAAYGGNQDAFVAKVAPGGRRLVWLTYLGGSQEDRGYGVRVDAAGFVYVVGITKSPDFPTTPDAFDPTPNGDADVFVAKLTPDGASLAYSTVIGGAAQDWSRGNMALGPSGRVFAGGRTDSRDFPTTRDAFQRTYAGNWDGFVFGLSADGSRLVVSSLIGGTGHDATYSGVSVHLDGSLYVAGMTNSTDFPATSGALQRQYGGGTGRFYTGDGFVARLSPDGSVLVYATYLGGSVDDAAAGNDGLAVDASGHAIFIGTTASEDFPVTAGALQKSYRGGSGDGFIARVSPDGTRLVQASYIGGSGYEETSGIAVDDAGNVYLSGNTSSADYPVTPNAVQGRYGGGDTDMMFTVVAPDLSEVLYSTYFGGSGAGGYGERGRCLALGPGGAVVISGDTNAPDFPVSEWALQRTYRGRTDGAIVEFTALSLMGDPGAGAAGPAR